MAEPVATTLDVRPLPPREKHARIHAAFSALAPGTALLLINDHDPRHLRYEFAAEHPGEFDWDYVESGPEVWRVRIGKLAAASAGDGPARPETGARAGEPAEPATLPVTLDVREDLRAGREPFARIMQAVDGLTPGQALVLYATFEPVPLLGVLEGRGFSHRCREIGGGDWEVRFEPRS